jgi:Transcriptional regulator/sugar kinase
MIIGAIEAGGTKFVCGLLEADCGDCAKPTILAKASVATTEPEETLGACLDFFGTACEERKLAKIDAMGIGSFGPVDLKQGSPTWGYITATPKPGWRDTKVAGYFRERLGVPVVFDTDVNAAAYGEYLWGAAKGVKDFVYVTVGTGIGGGVFSNGSLVHGLQHPELGHIKVRRVQSDTYQGYCPFHRDCLEGMASGPAIGARWNAKAESLRPEHEAWELEARYLAEAFAAYALVLSPERILLGGGVGLRPGLAERVSQLVGEELAGYLPALADPQRLASFVTRPQLGSEAGLVGSAGLALRYCQP